MEFKANSGVWGTMFGVPCIVADNFLKLADESQIKVLLYLLRYSGKSVTSEEISLNTGVSVEQANDAVMFWQQVNVLSQDMTLVVSTSAPEPVQEIQLETPVVAATPTVTAPTLEKTAPLGNAPLKTTQLHPSEIAEIICNDSNIAELFKIAETLLGPLNPAMQNSLIWMFNYLGLKKEVILILIGYCVETNKSNPKAIEKIASDWTEKEINTLETATSEVERLNNIHTYVNDIKRIFELRQNPTSNQQKFISQWQTEGYSIPLVHLAYEKTVEQINKVSFEYINKILISWKNSGFSSPDDVRKAEEQYRNKKQSHPTTSDGFNPDNYKIVINNI